VNPQQLRQTIEQQLLLAASLASPSADSSAEISLSAVTRRVAEQLDTHKAYVASPAQPLPSAECLAAFVERQTSRIEEQHVVASCVHDMGILFQLVNIIDQQIHSPVAAVPSDVMARLLSLGNKETHLPKPSASAVEKVPLSSGLQTERDLRTKSHVRRLWIGASILAASAIFLAFVIANLVLNDRRPTQDQLGVSPNDNSQPPKVNDQEDLPRIVETPSRSPDSIQVVEDKERQIPTDPESNDLANNPLNQSPNTNITDNVTTPEKMTTPVVAPSKLPMVKFGRWEKVVGILAASPDREYPIWEAVTESKRKDVVDETRVLTWLTPPGCYAQARYGDQGKLVLRENSVASFRIQEDRSGVLPICELHYGAIFIAGTQTKHQVQIGDSSSMSVRMELEENTSLLAWKENGELRFLPRGKVRSNGQLLVNGKAVRVSAEGLEVIQELKEEPGWCQQLPKQNVLTQTILGNLDESNDLAKSVDQQLSRMLSRPSVLSLKHIQQLALWRVAMEGDSPLRAAISPIPAVRMALFRMLMSDTTEMPFAAAKRNLLGRLQQGEGQRRIQIVRGQLKPTRQDLAAWLNELTGDDTEIAALADYMFRSRVQAGPDFDPTAPRVQREISKREWTRVITGR
jgi:hypothetical protein